MDTLDPKTFLENMKVIRSELVPDGQVLIANTRMLDALSLFDPPTLWRHNFFDRDVDSKPESFQRPRNRGDDRQDEIDAAKKNRPGIKLAMR